MESLKKIIERLILLEFPWIVDYEITLNNHPIYYHFNLIKIIYYTDGEFEINKDHEKIMRQTKTLYKMIGGINYHIYDGVTIMSIEDKYTYN